MIFIVPNPATVFWPKFTRLVHVDIDTAFCLLQLTICNSRCGLFNGSKKEDL
jgi:hypothetical protein